MLRYFSAGSRDFVTVPAGPHSRRNWEIFAVLQGRCGILREDGERLPLARSHLWVFPPGHVHGWHGEKAACEVAVFHFANVPSQLDQIVRPMGFLDRSLEPTEASQVRNLSLETEAALQLTGPLGELRIQRVLLDLTLLVLAGSSADLLSGSPNVGSKVIAAMSWYRGHLRDRPSVEDMAAAVHLSSSHLRRLFLAARGRSPQDCMVEIRVEKALGLLQETDLKLEAVAQECGFSSGSDLSRVIKLRRGCSPREWRAGHVPSHVRETAEIMPPSGTEVVPNVPDLKR